MHSVAGPPWVFVMLGSIDAFASVPGHGFSQAYLADIFMEITRGEVDGDVVEVRPRSRSELDVFSIMRAQAATARHDPKAPSSWLE